MASPLIRTLETAAGVFGHRSQAADSTSPGVWMREIQDEQGKQAAMTQINLPKTPVIAHEDCRETIGVGAASSPTQLLCFLHVVTRLLHTAHSSACLGR